MPECLLRVIAWQGRCAHAVSRAHAHCDAHCGCAGATTSPTHQILEAVDENLVLFDLSLLVPVLTPQGLVLRLQPLDLDTYVALAQGRGGMLVTGRGRAACLLSWGRRARARSRLTSTSRAAFAGLRCGGLKTPPRCATRSGGAARCRDTMALPCHAGRFMRGAAHDLPRLERCHTPTLHASLKYWPRRLELNPGQPKPLSLGRNISVTATARERTAMLTKLFRTELFHNLDYKSGCAFPLTSPPALLLPLRCGAAALRSAGSSCAAGSQLLYPPHRRRRVRGAGGLPRARTRGAARPA